MPETWENWLGRVNSPIYYARQIREIYLVLPYSLDSKAPVELWNPLSKAVFSKYSFISNEGRIWNDSKAQK